MKEGEDMQIIMLKTVRSDLPFMSNPGTKLLAGKVYEATTNKHGAVCGICENGELLGVKPDEFNVLFSGLEMANIAIMQNRYKKALELLEEVAEVMENYYGRETELTEKIRQHLA